MPITRGKIGHVQIVRARRDSPRSPASLPCAAPATPPLSVQRYSLEEGLSQQAVNAIAQDAEGFMWFGTEDGLNRFDGYEFRQLRHDRGDAAHAAERLDLLAGRQRRRLVDRHRWRRRGVPQRADRQARCTRRSCATRRTCSACARWRATVSAACGSPRAMPASRSSIRAPAS